MHKDQNLIPIAPPACTVDGEKPPDGFERRDVPALQ